MKNRLLLLLLMAFLAPWTAFAQSEFTIGNDATQSTNDSPYGGHYGYQYHVYLYDAADVDFSGTVTSVSFKSSTSSDANETANYTLYMKDVPSTTTLSSSTTFAEYTAGLSPVFSSTTMPALAQGWNTTTLTNTFEHQSGNSILVMARSEGCSESGGCQKFVYYVYKSNHAWKKKVDNTDPGPNVSGELTAMPVSIKFTYTPPYCEPPTNLHFVDITQNSAFAMWSGGTANFGFEYKKASETTWTVVCENNCGYYNTVNGLDPGTDYQYRVRSYCSDYNSYSQWVTGTFTTSYDIPFEEDFSTSSIPSNWTIYSGLLNDVMAGTATLTPVTENYFWRFGSTNGVFGNHAYFNIYGTSRKHWLVTPQMVMQNNCQLSFELALTKYAGTLQPVDPTLQPDDRFVVLASTDGGSTWTILREWNNTGSPYVYNNIITKGEDVAIDLTAYQVSNLMIAFYGESTIGNNGDNNLHIDNVSINYIPACQKPTNFHVSSIFDRSVVLSWDAPEGQNHWEVGYKTDDDSGYYWFTDPTENPCVFSGHQGRPLQPETHYTVKVRALCNGFSETSGWSKEIDFTTLNACAPPTNVTILETRPHGFTASFTPGTPTQTPNWFYYYSTSLEATYNWNSWINSNPFEVDRPSGNYAIDPQTTYYLWVFYYCEEDNELFWADPVSFTTPEACPAPTNVTVTSTTPHGFTATFTPGGDWQTQWCYNYTTSNTTPPTSAPGITTNTSFGISNLPDLNSNTTYYLWVGIFCEEDNTYHWGEPAAFTTAEACSKVFAQDVVVEDTQPHSVTLSWEDYQGMAAQWQVYYSFNNILPYNEEYINEIAYITNDPYVTINNLYGDTDYHFWIRSYCGDWYGTPQWSQWSEMITAHTLVSCPPPTNLVAHTTANSATISWTPGGNETEWTVEITSPEWSDYLPNFTTDVPYIVFDEELLASMWEDGICYEREFTVYVNAECGDPDGFSEPAALDFIVTDKQFLTVYDGTATNNRIPAYIFYFDDFTRSQFVIPADDLVEMKGTPISSMTFYTTSSNIPYPDPDPESNITPAPVDVYLMEVSDVTISAFQPKTNGTIVYQDTLAVEDSGSGGLLTIHFSTPYYYNGGNLLVGIENTDDEDYQNIFFYGQTVDGASISGSNGSSLDDVPAQQQNFIPKTTFSFLPSCEPQSLPYVYGFEDADELACWTMLDCDIYTDITSGAAHEGGHGFRFHFNQNPPQYLISPKLECNAAISASFYYRNYRDTYPETFQVGYSTTTKSPNAFIWGHVITANDQNTWKLFEEIFPEGTKYVAIKLLSNNMYDLYIDDFSFMPTFCSNANQCELTFELTDSWGDTWNGNAIKVVDESTGIVLGIMTNDYNNYDVTHTSGPYTQIKTLSVCDDRTIRFEWVSGSYINECSYIVTNINDEVIFYGIGAMSQPKTYTVNCDYLFVSNGDWDDSSNWSGGKVPPEGSDVIITADATIPEGYIVNADQVSIDGGSITVEDGGQLRHNTNGLVVTMKKNIMGYDDVNGIRNYYLLASPFDENITVPAELTAEGCDLYMFDENYPDAEWRNNKQTPINVLSMLEGYLFASPEDIELSLTGTTLRTVGYKLPNLPYSENPDNIFNGWYLMGNFYTSNAYIYTKNDDNELVPMQVMVYNEEGELVTLSGGPIPPMEGYFIKLTETTTIYFRSIPDSSAAPIGAIKGKFTVNDIGEQVYFSKGNLQYKASTNTWQFAEHQYDYLGDANSNISETYDGWIDLFGWGTSGYDHGAVCYQPWSTSQTNSDYYAYGNQNGNLDNQIGQADWGYNAIRNGGDQENSGWRTLTGDEWKYVFDDRTTTSGIRFVLGSVNGVYGVILLPDNWDASTYTLNDINEDSGDFLSNTISAMDWSTILEANGAVFLPRTGFRQGTSIDNTNCFYWSSTHDSSSFAYCVYIDNDNYIDFRHNIIYRSTGNTVRLVHPVN